MILYPKVDVQEWIEQYKLKNNPRPCLNCGVTFPYIIPVATKKYRGITQEEHGCGKEYVQTTLVPIGKESDIWWSLLK